MSLLQQRYQLLYKLAEGGYGETFLAKDVGLPSRRRCVVKRLWGKGDPSELGKANRPELQRPAVWQKVVEQFRREAALLEELSRGCDRIPQLYAYFEEEERLYLVQEWIEGVTLEGWLRQKGLQSAAATVALLRGVLDVLEHVHGRGVIHRDIKPSNIIVRNGDQSPVLIDFGVARELLAAEGAGAIGSAGGATIVGTLGYMAPEQAIGQPVFGSDLYSLGLVGRLVWRGVGPGEEAGEWGLGSGEWRGDRVAEGLAAILRRAIAPSPADRFGSAQEMQRALAALTSAPSTIDQELWGFAPEGLIVDASAASLTLPPPSALPVPASPASSSGPNSQLPTSDFRLPTSDFPLPPIPDSLHPDPGHSQGSNRDRQILINKVRNYWIKGVLETSLHHQALIQLHLEERLDAIGHPWAMAWETAAQSRRTLPPQMRVAEVFAGLGAGRSLLILGEPGAGKTTTLLELCRDLLERAERDGEQPIPVVFNLSAWSNRYNDLATWLVRELNSQYQVSQELARMWLARQQLLLLLDGLDEVQVSQRSACVKALNDFVRQRGGVEVVVCCRVQDYEVLNHRLHLQSALFIHPLNLAQVDVYLGQLGSELAAVRTALQLDPSLQELARSPLMLNILTLAYRGVTIAELPELTLEERREHLFERYVARMLERRGGAQGYPPRRALRWLVWLARQLQRQSQTIFLIEQLQPHWLTSGPLQWGYRLALMGCFVAMLVAGGMHFLTHDRLFLSVLFSIVIFGPIFGNLQIQTVETLRWSWRKAQRNLLPGAILGAGLGFGFKVIYELLLHPLGLDILSEAGSQFPWPSVVRGVLFGLSTGTLFGFIRSWAGPVIRRKATQPNQGIWQSAKHGSFFAFFGMLFLGTASAGINHGFMTWGIWGLLFGWTLGGGEACLKHGLLRLMLWQRGALPWNYAKFLDWATERIFLQKVGGGYIFVHRLLLEHLANETTRS